MTRSEHRRLIQAIRADEREPDKATERTDVKAEAKRLQRAKAELKTAEEEADK